MSEVKVHHSKDGCPIDGRTDPHTHSTEEWEEHYQKRYGIEVGGEPA